MRCSRCGKGVTPVVTKETTVSGQQRLVKRCPTCGWFFDAARVTDAVEKG
jgi:ribosomal protein S27AE